MLEAKKLDEIFEFLPDRIKEFSEAANVYISRWDENSKTVTGWAATGSSKKEYLDGKQNPEIIPLPPKYWNLIMLW
jgi:hypothetical protein